MIRVTKVYVDMDGVLSNFEGRVSEILGKDISLAKSSEIWKGVHRYNEDVQPFYATLETITDAPTLWKFVVSNFEHVEVLTASGYTPKDAEAQKHKWCAERLTGQKSVNVVKKSGDKASFADPQHILIDDRSQSIDPWVEAGGIGILHTSAEETIKELKQYL